MTYDEMQHAIETFRGLEPNWDSYGSEEISEEAIYFASLIASVISGKKWHVAPMSDGGIQFESDEVEIEIRHFKMKAAGRS